MVRKAPGNFKFAQPAALVPVFSPRYACRKRRARRSGSREYMRFKVVIGEQVYAIEVPEDLLREAAEFHAKLDRDMDGGWQMSREFVERPDRMQRCQIVADKLLTSIMQDNQATAMLMAAYIALRMPPAIGVDIDTSGEMQNTRLLYA
jgi:hypothetical protein